MTKEEIIKIILTELPFSKCEIDEGIYESSSISSPIGDISIGLSYETSDEGKKVYIYNLFIDEDEYINIFNTGTKENPLPDSVVDEIEHTWNELIKKEGK